MKYPHFLAATLLLATSPGFNVFYTGTNDQRWSMVACVIFAYVLYALLKRKQQDLSAAVLEKICIFITAYICIYTYSYYFINPTSLIGPFENPNVLSIHLCLLLPFVHNYAQGLNGQKKHFIQIIELVSIITIILTMCRAGWICLIIFVCLYLQNTNECHVAYVSNMNSDRIKFEGWNGTDYGGSEYYYKVVDVTKNIHHDLFGLYLK